MRIRAWSALGAVAVALILGFVADASGQDWIFVVAGVGWLVAIVLGLSLLPFWRRVLPRVPDMNGLFRRPGDGERWCAACGSPAPQSEDCGVCGAPPRMRKPRRAKASGS